MSHKKQKTSTTSAFGDLEEQKRTTATIPTQPLPEHCPANWKRFAGNGAAIGTLKNEARNIAGKVIVVWGPTGVGKTCACRLVFENTTFVHDLRSLGEPLLQRLSRLATSKRHYAREVVLLDPLEEIARNPSFTKKLCDTIARVAAKSGMGFVLVANDIYSKAMYPLRTHRGLGARVIRFYALRNNDIKTILVNLGLKQSSRICQGIRVAAGDGRKAEQFVRLGGHTADQAVDRFAGCKALIEGRRDKARSAESRGMLSLLHANAPLVAMGQKRSNISNLDLTLFDKKRFNSKKELLDFIESKIAPKHVKAYMAKVNAYVAKGKVSAMKLDTCSQMFDCASFGDIVRNLNAEYEVEATIALAASQRLHPIPVGQTEFPMPPYTDKHDEIRRKARLMGVPVTDLHLYTTTLRDSIRQNTAEAHAMKRARVTHWDYMYKKLRVSAEIGLHPIQTMYRKRFQKKLEY